jgi:regulator of RNase E activity RraA
VIEERAGIDSLFPIRIRRDLNFGVTMTLHQLEPSVLKELQRLDSCSVSNAIETFGVRMRNTGFSNASIHCLFEDAPAMVGYASTIRIRTVEPPMESEGYFYRLDWLDYFSSIPTPRVLVLEDMDGTPGLGAFVGDIHANVLSALGCIGIVTNGAVRDVETARGLKLQMFAHNSSVSHSFAHVMDFGSSVMVAGMEVRSGDVLHGDRHGVQTIPFQIASSIPGVVQRMRDEELEIIRLAQSSDFSVEKLRTVVEAIRAKRKNLEA